MKCEVLLHPSVQHLLTGGPEELFIDHCLPSQSQDPIPDEYTLLLPRHDDIDNHFPPGHVLQPIVCDDHMIRGLSAVAKQMLQH